MARKSLRISLPVHWSEACSENFHKTNENSDCINETFEGTIDHLSGRHFSGWKLIRRNDDIKGPH